jgi:predicted PurR-regulated permease PerM
MADLSSLLKSWIIFAGGVLVIAVLYWAQAVLIPIAIAALLTFLLAPAATWLERRIGRGASVGAIVVLTFTLLGLGGWAAARQFAGLADALPGYRQNIREKIADVRAAGKGGSVEKVQQTIEDIQTEIVENDAGPGRPGAPVVIQPEAVQSLWGLPAWVSPFIEPLSTAGLVAVLVVFMLLERQDLRDRVIGVVGHGHLTSTTKALDEAAARVSRYLLMQSLVNAMYGVGVAAGLYLLGVPYYLLWAILGAVLRFVPYVGPIVAAGAPILISLAALPGWTKPLYVVGLFVGLELFTNLVLETLLYAGAAGVSQVALLVAVAFWTWLWGPVGLMLATPLTVCLVVLGKHVSGLEFLATLMADAPALTPDVRYYQRLLARDEAEAAEIIEAHAGEHGGAAVFDALMLPALTYAERDRAANRLSAQEEAAVVELTRDLIDDVASLATAEEGRREEAEAPGDVSVSATPPMSVLAYGVNSEADVLALRMLQHLLRDVPVALDLASARVLASELVASVTEHGYRAICIADLPPSPPSKTRYLIRKLRAAAPGLKIVVGRWAPASLADESVEQIREAGADFVGTTLEETREHVRQLAQHLALAAPAPAA